MRVWRGRPLSACTTVLKNSCTRALHSLVEPRLAKQNTWTTHSLAQSPVFPYEWCAPLDSRPSTRLRTSRSLGVNPFGLGA